MSTEATPVVPPVGTPPAAPTATPSNAQPETVTLDKQAHDQLVKDAARASTAQSEADRYKNVLKKNGLIGGGHFKPAEPATPPTLEERQAAGAAEDQKAERGLLALALDPAFREVLDADHTLRDLITKNPLAVLPILAPDALDADDALALVREALDKRKPAATPAIPATPATPPVTSTPPVGGINPKDQPVDENYEAARKIPNTEHALAGMINAKIRASAGKK